MIKKTAQSLTLLLLLAGAANVSAEEAARNTAGVSVEVEGEQQEVRADVSVSAKSSEVAQEDFLGARAEATISRERETEPAAQREQSTVSDRSRQRGEEIDAMIARYRSASRREAYRIMNEIKMQIARMNTRQQIEAIDALKAAVSTHAEAQKRSVNTEKKKAQNNARKRGRSMKREMTKRSRRVRSEVKSRARKIQATAKSVTRSHHTNPMDALNGSFGPGGSLGSVGGVGEFGFGEFGGGMGGGF